MKLNICDVCYRRDNKIIKSFYRCGWKQRDTNGYNLRIDTCKTHRDILKTEKITPDTMLKWFRTLHPQIKII